MNRLVSLSIALMVPMLSPPSCAPAPRVSPPAAVVSAAPEGRRAQILSRVKAICPTPLSVADLDAAADLVERRPEAVAVVGRLNLMDKQSRICRGERP